jgi:hypothetical protein
MKSTLDSIPCALINSRCSLDTNVVLFQTFLATKIAEVKAKTDPNHDGKKLSAIFFLFEPNAT